MQGGTAGTAALSLVNLGTAILGTPATGEFTVELTGGVEGKVTGNVTPAEPEALPGGESTDLTLHVSAAADAPEHSYFTVTVSCGGYSAEANVHIVVPAKIELTLDEILLGAMPGGDGVDEGVTITNTGGANLTGIEVTLPAGYPWMTVALQIAPPADAPEAMGEPGGNTLAPGESLTFKVTATPGPNVQNMTYTDDVVIRFDQSDPIRVPVTVQVTDQVTGSLSLTVVDDMGWVVDGAQVNLTLVSSPFTDLADPQIVQRSGNFSAQTDASGVMVVDNVLAGTYDYRITASSHMPADGQVSVTGGTLPVPVVATMQFMPFNLGWKTQESTEEQTLGQTTLQLVMQSPSDDLPVLVTDRPALEYFLEYDGASMSDISDMLSINNPGDESIYGVVIRLRKTGSTSLPITFSNGATQALIVEIEPSSSVLISLKVQGSVLATTDIGDQGLLDSAIELLWSDPSAGLAGFAANGIDIPVRVRWGPTESEHMGQQYLYTPFVGYWPTGSVKYGNSFIEQWFAPNPVATPGVPLRMISSDS